MEHVKILFLYISYYTQLHFLRNHFTQIVLIFYIKIIDQNLMLQKTILKIASI